MLKDLYVSSSIFSVGRMKLSAIDFFVCASFSETYFKL